MPLVQCLPQGGHFEAMDALVEAGAETGVTCDAAGSSGVDALMMACRLELPRIGNESDV